LARIEERLDATQKHSVTVRSQARWTITTVVAVLGLFGAVGSLFMH